MTDPTPEEWTKRQIDAMMIYRARRAHFSAGFDEVNCLISRVTDLKNLWSLHNPATVMAIDSLIEEREILRKRMCDAHEYELAYERIIISRDMSEGAFERALAEVRERREQDESQ